jgi:hypothetical protein
LIAGDLEKVEGVKPIHNASRWKILATSNRVGGAAYLLGTGI